MLDNNNIHKTIRYYKDKSYILKHELLQEWKETTYIKNFTSCILQFK